MRRYWVPREMMQGPLVNLKGDVLHHIRDVCRMSMGSKFEVIVDAASAGGVGAAHLVEIISETKHESIAKILESREIPELGFPRVILAMSIPRIPVFEAVLEKAVEIGVHSIYPFYSDFSFIRGASEIFDKKRPRFEKIVQSATQQSGRGDLMKIEEPVHLDVLLSKFASLEGVGGLFAFEGAGVLTAREGLDALRANPATQTVWSFVGSEGGFSEAEVEKFKQIDLKPVTLGPQVLRVETACVTLVGIIKYAFDLMR